MKKILLAVDGSEKSMKAAEKARDLALSTGANLTLITVVADNFYYGSPDFSQNMSPGQMQELIEESKKQAEKKGEKILEEVETYMKEKDIEVKKIIHYGDSAENICRVAEEDEFDLIVLADKGEGGVKRFLLGSTSDRVVRHADTSVLIVK
ncbi:MAG: universal stress protein [Halanaerobiaceae bacterium]